MASGKRTSLWWTLGGGLVVVIVAVAAGFAVLHHERASKAPPPASTGGLIVQTGRPDDAKPDPTTPLRCFVNGQFVGTATLADCARKNGVATQALDVGLDSAGAAAAGQPDSSLVPPAPTAADGAAPDDAMPVAAPAPAVVPANAGATGDCLRYGPAGWRRLGDALTLNACVQALYAGHCEPIGGASYGRWMGQTLRLVPHRVEIAPDNHSFRPLVQQSDGACAIGDF